MGDRIVKLDTRESSQIKEQQAIIKCVRNVLTSKFRSGTILLTAKHSRCL